MSALKRFILIICAAVIVQALANPTSTSRTLPAAATFTLGPEITVSDLDNSKYSPAVAYNSMHEEYLVVWENVWPGGSHDIYAQRLDSQGRLLSWFLVEGGPKNRMQPSVAYDPVNDRYLVVYILDVAGDGSNWDVVGRFIPWEGPSSGLTEFTICDWASSQWHPQVAYGRAQEEYMVVWMNAAAGVSTYISGRRVFANGSGFPTSKGFTISSGSQGRDFPKIAYNLSRNEYLAVWDVVNSGTGVDIYGLRMTATGTALGAEIAIAGWPDDEEKPAVAACFQPDQYLVGWQSKVEPATGNYDIYGRYVAGDGTLAGVYLVDGTTAPEANVALACDQAGKEYLFAWQTMYATAKYGIWARKAFADETMEPAFGIVQPGPSTDRIYPAVAGGSSSSLIAWEHQRDGTTFQDIHARVYVPNMLYLPLVRKH